MSAECMFKTVLFTEICQAIKIDGIETIEKGKAGPELEKLLREIATYKGERDKEYFQNAKFRLWKHPNYAIDLELINVQHTNVPCIHLKTSK